ncbi:hypothetical protein ACLOJK_017515 [Asimina triloba]
MEVSYAELLKATDGFSVVSIHVTFRIGSYHLQNRQLPSTPMIFSPTMPQSRIFYFSYVEGIRHNKLVSELKLFWPKLIEPSEIPSATRSHFCSNGPPAAAAEAVAIATCKDRPSVRPIPSKGVRRIVQQRRLSQQSPAVFVTYLEVVAASNGACPDAASAIAYNKANPSAFVLPLVRRLPATTPATANSPIATTIGATHPWSDQHLDRLQKPVAHLFRPPPQTTAETHHRRPRSGRPAPPARRPETKSACPRSRSVSPIASAAVHRRSPLSSRCPPSATVHRSAAVRWILPLGKKVEHHTPVLQRCTKSGAPSGIIRYSSGTHHSVHPQAIFWILQQCTLFGAPLADYFFWYPTSVRQ